MVRFLTVVSNDRVKLLIHGDLRFKNFTKGFYLGVCVRHCANKLYLHTNGTRINYRRLDYSINGYISQLE